MNEVKEFIKELRTSGVYIRGENLGISEIDNDKIIVPKNLTITFDGWEECSHPEEDCNKCEFGGCCNLASFEEATISKIGGKTSISFVRWCGYQIGSVWTKWQRVG